MQKIKNTMFTLLFLTLAVGIYAQEARTAIGGGLEWNMNSRDNFAAGIVMAFDYRLPHAFAMGLNLGVSSNFSGITVLEPGVLLRGYFSESGDSGLFVQADLGTFLIFENGETTPMFKGGLRGGFRLPLETSLYIEPFGRLGYPFAFGIGAVVGVRFFEHKEEMIFRR